MERDWRNDRAYDISLAATILKMRIQVGQNSLDSLPTSVQLIKLQHSHKRHKNHKLDHTGCLYDCTAFRFAVFRYQLSETQHLIQCTNIGSDTGDNNIHICSGSTVEEESRHIRLFWLRKQHIPNINQIISTESVLEARIYNLCKTFLIGEKKKQ